MGHRLPHGRGLHPDQAARLPEPEESLAEYNAAREAAIQASANAQQAGVEFEYHVIAVNKTGEGKPSNIVRVVL